MHYFSNELSTNKLLNNELFSNQLFINNPTIYLVRATICCLNLNSSSVSLLSRALWAITSSCSLQWTATL